MEKGGHMVEGNVQGDRVGADLPSLRLSEPQGSDI